MPDRGAAVTNFVKEIPGALPLLWHFFNQLQTSAWLPHLARHRYRMIVVRSLRRGEVFLATADFDSKPYRFYGAASSSGGRRE